MQQHVDTEKVVQNLKASWKESGLKNKLLFTFAIIALFRFGAQLPILVLIIRHLCKWQEETTL